MLGVLGYRIGGKTGTSEDGVNTGKYVTSFVGVAPISDPQVVVLITLYNPTGEGGHQGGGVAAPIASQVLGEILPALEISPDKADEENVKQSVIVPEVRNLTVKDALDTLKKVGLEGVINTEQEIDKENTIVTEQLPKPGLSITQGTRNRIKRLNDSANIKKNRSIVCCKLYKNMLLLCHKKERLERKNGPISTMAKRNTKCFKRGRFSSS